MHPHMLRHTFVTTMLDAGVDLRDQIAARHADPRTTMRYDPTAPARTSTDTPTTSSPHGLRHLTRRPVLPMSGRSMTPPPRCSPAVVGESLQPS